MLRNKYNQRVDEINDFFSLLSYFDSIETYRKVSLTTSSTASPLIVTSTQQKCLRSNAVLMLYNIIEATVVECVLAIFDAIKDEHLKYSEIVDVLRDQWLKAKMDNNDSIKTRVLKTKEIICNINSDIVFSESIGRFNGNVDLRVILSVCKDLKIQLGPIPNKNDVSLTLKAVKDARNHLAHGDISYSTYGSSVLLSDIIKYKNNTFDFLAFFMDRIDDYISEERYKRKVSTQKK